VISNLLSISQDIEVHSDVSTLAHSERAGRAADESLAVSGDGVDWIFGSSWRFTVVGKCLNIFSSS
jgi:hypothetical protein